MEQEGESLRNACSIRVYLHVFTVSLAHCIFPVISFILWTSFFHSVSTSENAFVKSTVTSLFSPVHTFHSLFSYWTSLPHSCS